MLETRRVLRIEESDLHDYEVLLSQVPLVDLRGCRALSYLQKLVTFGEVHAVYEDGRPRGFIGFYANDNITRQAYLSFLVVDSSLRGKGCGASLVERFIDVCRAAEMRSIELNVAVFNHAAIDFYSRFGFHTAGRGRDDEHIRMCMNLQT